MVCFIVMGYAVGLLVYLLVLNVNVMEVWTSWPKDACMHFIVEIIEKPKHIVG